MEDSKQNYKYETKCKKCGKIHEWYFMKKSEFSYTKFMEALFEKSKYPSIYDCDKCKTRTFQEVVSYGDF